MRTFSKDCIYDDAAGQLLDKLEQLKKDYSRDQR